MTKILSTFLSVFLLIQTTNALCSFDCDNNKCCYAGTTNTRCQLWNGTVITYGDSRPHKVIVFNNTVCWRTFENVAECTPTLNIQAEDIRDFGNLLFIKGKDNKVTVIGANKSYELTTTAWFAETPPSRLVINNYGVCEWIDQQSNILCDQDGHTKRMALTDTCDSAPLTNAFNLIALVGICISLLTLCTILVYYRVNTNNVVLGTESEKVEMITVEQKIKQENIDALI